LLYAVTGRLAIVDVVEGMPDGGVVHAGSPGEGDRTVVFRVWVDQTSPDALPGVFVLGPAMSAVGVILGPGADLAGHLGIGGAGFAGPVGIGETSDRFFVSFPSLEPGNEVGVGIGLPSHGAALGTFAVEATACDDGLDNDDDGWADDADPGCYDLTSTNERPQCQDGLNNDNQAGIDFDGGASLDIDPQDNHIDIEFNPATPMVGAADPQCVGKAWLNKEKTGGCGLGFEVVFLAPVLARLARRRRA
jgi:hypothetical protein